MCKKIQYVASHVIWPPVMNLFCLQVKIHHTQTNTKFPTPHHFITNLAYWLNPCHKRNLYLRARLGICADVNIMPASVYKLVFQEPYCKIPAPSKLEIGTYTTNTTKVVGSCMFYLVYPDSKCLLKVIFYVASNNGTVLLLAWLNIYIDWTIFHLCPVWLLAVLTTQRRPSPKLMFIGQRRSLKCLTTKVWFQSSLQVRNKFLSLILMVVMVLDTFPSPPYHIPMDPSVTLKKTPC